MDVRIVSVQEIANIICQHRNEDFTFSFKPASKMYDKMPETFHCIMIKPVKDGVGRCAEVYRYNSAEILRISLSDATAIAVYKHLIPYFNYYGLPWAVLAGSHEELLTFCQSKKSVSKERIEYAHLNSALLGLILFIQRSRNYHVSRCEIMGGSPDWTHEVKRDWNDIPGSAFEKAGIKRNNHNFEAMLQFQVTEAMLNASVDDLHAFETPFWS